MKILHVLNHTRRLNGHVHQAIDLACMQSRLGHNVVVASSYGDFDDLLTAEGVVSVPLNHSRRAGTLLSSAREIVSMTPRFDIVHAHMMTSAVLAWPACKINRKPLITTVHNEFEKSSIIMGLGSRVICVSGAVATSMERRGIPKSRLRTVLNGTIGTPRFPNLPGVTFSFQKTSILYVGGLHARKGIVDLIAAFELVLEKSKQVTLHIVGEGPSETEYRNMASKSISASSITFHGSQADPRPWFAAADIFVLPSHQEPAGLVLSEACEGRCAIVATNVGGIPEMLDEGRAGALVPPHSPQQLAEVIIALISDDGLLLEAKRRAHRNASRLTVQRMAQETLSIYGECISEHS